MATEPVKQPEWFPPPERSPCKLKLYNALTCRKEEFRPQRGNRVVWYNCGPTVYDSAHIGHARNYICMDILRRIMEGYFGYDVFMVMNITDIDDKIILRSRQQYLLRQRKSRTLNEVQRAFSHYLRNAMNREGDWDQFTSKVRPEITKEIEDLVKEGSSESLERATKLRAHLSALTSSFDNPSSPEATDAVFAIMLDHEKGHTVTDLSVFRNFTTFWEQDFFEDMEALHVRQPDVLTRVSEFVPEIEAYVKRIMEHGYAYESNGSVYFDVASFKRKHPYAKLKPWNATREDLLAEGEGALSQKGEKRSPADFALWKKSKPGEPMWKSVWGEGRPGWHIECSAMASWIVSKLDGDGRTLDIHSGGIDLAFPHHDNEIAQAEAYYDCKQWVNYFFHAGHLHIQGSKMSKSLKNFISIKEALTKYTPEQIRLLFLMSPWGGTLDFKESSMKEAIGFEATLRNFVQNVQALVQEAESTPSSPYGTCDRTASHDVRDQESSLMNALSNTQEKVHLHFCDNINTAAAIRVILDLINETNVYIGRGRPNRFILAKVGEWVTKMLKTFGLCSVGSRFGYGFSQNTADKDLIPILRVFSGFRDQIRTLARQGAPSAEILALCDRLRDVDLVPHGVVLDDREEGKPALVKLCDPSQLQRMRDEKLAHDAAKQKAKEESKQKLEERRLERFRKGKIRPEVLFQGRGEFSQFDDKGLPTHDADGKEISKSARKKLQKEYDQQVKLHREYSEGRLGADGKQ